MRNVIEQARQGRKAISHNRDLSMREVQQLISLAVKEDNTATINAIYEAIGTAYYMGYAVGERAGKEKHKQYVKSRGIAL